MRFWNLSLIAVLGVVILFRIEGEGSSPHQETAQKNVTAPAFSTGSEAQPESAPIALLAKGRSPASTVLEDFLKELDPKSQWRIGKTEYGRVTSFSGGYIHGQGATAQEALPFARSIAEYLAVDAQSLTVDESFYEPNENPLSKTFSYQQIVEGHEVYGSYLRIFIRREDDAIYYVNNRLKDIRGSGFKALIAEDEVREITSTHYPDADVEALEISPRPVLFARPTGPAILVWKVVLRVRTPKHDRRELLLSAETGDLVQDLSLLIN